MLHVSPQDDLFHITSLSSAHDWNLSSVVQTWSMQIVNSCSGLYESISPFFRTPSGVEGYRYEWTNMNTVAGRYVRM
jgi:hypothetical protein